MKYRHSTVRKKNAVKWVHMDKKLDVRLKHCLMSKTKCCFKMIIKYHSGS